MKKDKELKKFFVGCVLAIVLGGLAVLTRYLLDFTTNTPLFLLLPVVAFVTIYFGRLAGLFATLFTAFLINLFFLSPDQNFSSTATDIYLTMIYAIEGIVAVFFIEAVKNSREDVSKEKEWFKTTLKSIDDAVIATDRDGNISFINPSALQITEWSLNEVLGKKLTEVFHIYDSAKKKRAINPIPKVMKSNRSTHREEDSYLLSSSGKRHEIDYSISPIFDRDHEPVGTVLIFRDISQRKFVREGMGRMATIVNTSNDAIYSIDLAGRVKTWNRGAENLFGFTEGEIVGKNLKKFTVPAARAVEYDKAVNKLVKKTPVPPFETIRKTKNGELLQVLISASPIYDTDGQVSSVSVVTTDISARKKMEEELAFANRRFELASQAVRGLIYDWDFKTDYVYRSPGLLAVTGFKPEEVPPKKDWWMSRIHPEDREKLKWWENLNFKTKGKYTVEYRFLQKNNQYVTLWDHGLMEKDSRGVPIRIIGSAIDFSEKEEQEQKKNEFISMASHELKTPLTSLKVFTQLLQNLFRENPQANQLLGKMNDQVDSLTSIVSDLLDVSKIESGKLKLRKINFSLDRLISETVEMIQATSPSHQIVRKGKLSQNLFADKERVNEVLINLLTNAIKYSPDADKVELSVARQNGHALVKVRDFGIGIAKKNLPFVFDRFFRVYGSEDKNYPGLGMGLYISSEIVRRHHGKMWVRSKKGDGSTFYFTIPLKPNA